MNLLLKLLLSPWFWVNIALSVCGGVIVAWGLFLEKRAEKLIPPADFKSDIFDDIVSAQRAKLERGWRILMTGIVFEVVAAFGISIISGLEVAELQSANLQLKLKALSLERQVAETSNNVVKIDPRNANISDMSATAFLFVKDTHFNELTNWSRRAARINLCNKDTAHWRFDTLNADNYTKNDVLVLLGGYMGDREYGMRFRSFNFLAGNGVETPVRAIDDVGFLRMEMGFLPRGCEISGGLVELVVNNAHKMFRISPQLDTNAPDGNPGFPYSVIATNVPAD